MPSVQTGDDIFTSSPTVVHVVAVHAITGVDTEQSLSAEEEMNPTRSAGRPPRLPGDTAVSSSRHGMALRCSTKHGGHQRTHALRRKHPYLVQWRLPPPTRVLASSVRTAIRVHEQRRYTAAEAPGQRLHGPSHSVGFDGPRDGLRTSGASRGRPRLRHVHTQDALARPTVVRVRGAPAADAPRSSVGATIARSTRLPTGVIALELDLARREAGSDSGVALYLLFSLQWVGLRFSDSPTAAASADTPQNDASSARRRGTPVHHAESAPRPLRLSSVGISRSGDIDAASLKTRRGREGGIKTSSARAADGKLDAGRRMVETHHPTGSDGRPARR
ncbi:hypothetical protein DFH11DRAFT_1729503 [Phellopilus nigrolimitatus]|nr:hypothetical protein DFH11DRAFT_1729503 [Phellopilus nigrolimitatus]